MALDRRAVAVGAVVALAITLPPIWVVRLLAGDESNLWFVAVLALFAGFLVGGRVAARQARAHAVGHAAAAALGAFAVIALLAVVRLVATGRGVSLAAAITLLLLLQITVSLAVLGGWLGSR